jgi:hypothetical protein
MKKVALLSLFFVIILQSCSNDETTLEASTGNSFFPFLTGNFWNYKPDFNNSNSLKDSLFIKRDTVINGLTYKKFKTQNTPTGFYCAILNGNSLRQSGNKLLLTGNAGLDFSAALPIDLALNDFVVFSENAAANEELATKSGNLNQTFSSLPLTMNYNLRSVAVSSLPSYTTSGNRTFQDVKSVNVIFNLKITTLFAGFPVTIMNQQDVVTCTLYYAKNIGVVYAKTRVKYQLQSLPAGTGLPIPSSVDETTEEFLTTYKSN